MKKKDGLSKLQRRMIAKFKKLGVSISHGEYLKREGNRKRRLRRDPVREMAKDLLELEKVHRRLIARLKKAKRPKSVVKVGELIAQGLSLSDIVRRGFVPITPRSK